MVETLYRYLLDMLKFRMQVLLSVRRSLSVNLEYQINGRGALFCKPSYCV